jgi:sulfite reductase (NADPH) hemoprotein beta-component
MAFQSESSAAAVARIATLSSSALLHVASSASTSVFSKGLQDTSKYSGNAVEIEQVSTLADPASQLVRVTRQQNSSKKPALVSFLATADQTLLTSLVPHLATLLTTPTVISIATKGEHADVMALRSSGLILLYSSSPTQAHDHALLAARIAFSRSTAVLHFFDDATGSVEDEITESDIKTLLNRGKASSQSNGINGEAHSNGNGLSNGHSNGDRGESHDELSKSIDESFSIVSDIVGRPLSPFTLHGDTQAKNLAVVLGPHARELGEASSDLCTISVNLVRPYVDEAFRSTLPDTIERVATLEQSLRRSTRISPLFVDVATAFQRGKGMGGAKTDSEDAKFSKSFVLVSGMLGYVDQSEVKTASDDILRVLNAPKPYHGFVIGNQGKLAANVLESANERVNAVMAPIKVPQHEQAYNIILEQLFSARLAVVNAPDDEGDAHPAARSPEYAFGQVVAQLEERDELVRTVKQIMKNPTQADISSELLDALTQWSLTSGDEVARRQANEAKFTSMLQGVPANNDVTKRLQSLVAHVSQKSRWIVGSDAWAYDVGMGGVHHVIASGKNVNMLIFDTLPYTQRDALEAHKRKKDIGLYAMNYGNVYVASTAVYADYTQVLQALMEADKFEGPSIILAYVPYRTQDAPALEVLRETKLAVDSGYWPLYRWDPSAEAKGKPVFRLDSSRIREQLKTFLDRQNHLTYLVNSTPELAYDLVSSQGTGLRNRQKRKAKEAYEALLGSMDGPPLLVLYASDGGNAEKVAKKLTGRAKARGLAARILAMDDFPTLDELKDEKNVAFITSTAGQGESPQNGRETMKALNKLQQGALKSAAQVEEEAVKYTVFAMGDSHYWPRPEDAHYYNKSGKDLDARLEVLGADRLAPLGLGDDQDADGYMTGYKIWEPSLWKALGVDSIEVAEAEPEPITNEHMKIASNYLRGTIVEGLADKTTGAIAETDTQMTKFHGTYMQYDRDTADERKAAGLEPAYSFMIRCRIPGGVITPSQYVVLDQVASDYGNETMKITTRQTLQYHCIVKSNLKAAMQGINKSMLDTIAACGDVNRNVMCSPNPHISDLHADTYEFAKGISEYLLPRMDAYHEIWLDKETESKKELLMGGALKDYEPLYGPYYLPRKFKIAIAVPPRNDVDCFAHDIGLIAIADKEGRLVGFNVAVGGGMGVTHGMKPTYPRTGDIIGYVDADDTKEVCKQIMLTQRDFGNRTNRKQARLKYTIDNHFKGPENFRIEVERRLGWKLQEARPFSFDANTDEYGWRKQRDGKWTCMLWLENGRIQDKAGLPFRTGVRELCLSNWFEGEIRLSPNQHMALCNIPNSIKSKVEAHLQDYNMVLWEQSALALSASACVAFPTCGLAMAESERSLFPDLIDKLDTIIKRLGLGKEEIITRMTGCPNGCARPWLAEIGFVGKAPGTYLMLLGGNRTGSRVNKVYSETVTLPEAIEILEPMFVSFANEKGPEEGFGDFVIRKGIIKETKKGSEFWDGVKPLALPDLATSG